MRESKRDPSGGYFDSISYKTRSTGYIGLWVAASPMMERRDPRDPSVKLSTRAALAIVLITAAVILCILLVNP